MLTQLLDKDGNQHGYRMEVHSERHSQDTLFITGLGYIRTMDGTDIGRMAWHEHIEEEEVDDVYHYDFIGYDNVVSLVYRLLENGTFDLNVIRAYVVEHSLGKRYAFTTHNCGHRSDCDHCAREDAELDEAYRKEMEGESE